MFRSTAIIREPCNNLQQLFVFCVKTAQLNKIVRYSQLDGNSQIQVYKLA